VTQLPGVILAGGQSTRMGGGDKSLLPLKGEPLLARVIERLASQAAPLLTDISINLFSRRLNRGLFIQC